MAINYKIEFQYKPPDYERPLDEIIHEEEFISEQGTFIPFPAPGDSVYIDGQNYMVLTRHFIYHENLCVINIVVTDINEEEMAARLKE